MWTYWPLPQGLYVNPRRLLIGRKCGLVSGCWQIRWPKHPLYVWVMTKDEFLQENDRGTIYAEYFTEAQGPGVGPSRVNQASPYAHQMTNVVAGGPQMHTCTSSAVDFSHRPSSADCQTKTRRWWMLHHMHVFTFNMDFLTVCSMQSLYADGTTWRSFPRGIRRAY